MTTRPIADWQAHCIEQLGAVPGVAIVRWLERAPSKADPSTTRAGPRASGILPDVLSGMPPEDADQGVQRRGALDKPEQTGAVDVLLDLTAPGLGLPTWAGEVWRFGYGPTLTSDADRAAITDYVWDRGKTRAALVRADDGFVLRDGWLQTPSWWRGALLDHLLSRPAGWPASAAFEKIDLTRSTNPVPVISDLAVEPARSSALRDRLPRPVLVVGAVGRRMIKARASLLQQPDWNIGFIDAPIERMLSETKPPITWLPSRPGHYVADPFGLERDGILHVLFEDYDQRVGIGSIQHLTITADGAASEPELVLDTRVHASYPFLFEHDGSVFLLPETSAARELILYEAEDFPSRWRAVATLLAGVPAVDASVVQHEGRWWMFASRVDHGPNDCLSIWHAPVPTGPWTPHLGNPVKTDIRSARPGGTPFVVDGTLYRPSQDGSRVYGGRLVINRVDLLTPQAFREQPVAILAPQPGSPYPDGLHTLSAVGQRTLVDGNKLHMVRESSPRILASVVRRLSGRPWS